MMEQVNRTYRELCLELLKAWNRSEGGSYSDFGKAAEQIAKRIDAFVFANDSTPLQANAPDWLGLCEELTEHLALLDEPPHELVCRAQEALAQPEPEVVGPSDEELLATLDKAIADFPPRHPEAEALDAVEYPLALELRKARAILARWGRPAPAPAAPVPLPGEDAGELALRGLERTVVLLMPVTGHKKIKRFDTIRAALKRLQELENKADLSPAPVPVAVSERLPGPEDCDAEGRCWAWRNFDPNNDDDGEFWQLIPAEWLPVGGGWIHWLPAHALPLPSVEVEA